MDKLATTELLKTRSRSSGNVLRVSVTVDRTTKNIDMNAIIFKEIKN